MTTTSTYSSTASLLSEKTSATPGPHRKSQPKDYEAAFGSLVSMYGFSGATPSVPKPQPRSRPVPKNSKPPQPANSKNYGAAFGGLSSSYGLDGSLPTLFRKQ
ncbi:hypothetical protein BD779DRAFT_1478382 [Infundibulicybe gibba]|nr:hypothetical protein BD779DRAFT_1478382 [Infundibulicybe gibba]